MPKPASEAAGAVTAGALLARARQVLAAAGVSTPGLDARVLVGDSVGLDAAGLLARENLVLAPDRVALSESRIAERAAGKPVGRILGHRPFFTLDLSLSPETLEPRPETECLVEWVLSTLAGRGPAARAPVIADLGTGSGAILLSLLSALPAARGIGTDIAGGALATARANARRHGLDARALFAMGDFFAPMGEGVDVVVSNPPYVPTRAISCLAAEVREHDPVLALDGGIDGLVAYRTIFAQVAASHGRSRPGAAQPDRPGPDVFVELSPDLQAPLERVAADHGFVAVGWQTDLAGLMRCGHFRLLK